MGDSHTRRSSKREARLERASRIRSWFELLRSRAATVRICDQRGRECEQTDGKHDERAVPMSDPAHGSLLSGFVCAPVTLDLTPNSSTTGG